MLRFIVVTVLSFVSLNAWAKVPDLNEQIRITQYMVGAMKDLPENHAKINKVSVGLGKKDQEILKQVLRKWSLKDMNFKISARLNQVIISKNDRTFLTIETVETSPMTLMLNGSQRLVLDSKNVFESLTRQLNPGNSKSASAQSEFLKFIFIGSSATAADSDYNVNKLSGLGEAILVYGDVMVGSEAQDTPPWKILERDKKRLWQAQQDPKNYTDAGNIEGDIAKEMIWKEEREKQTKFTCGEGKVSGSVLILGKMHKFETGDKGMLLDNSNLISAKASEMKITPDLFNAMDEDPIVCNRAMGQIFLDNGLYHQLESCDFPSNLGAFLCDPANSDRQVVCGHSGLRVSEIKGLIRSFVLSKAKMPEAKNILNTELTSAPGDIQSVLQTLSPSSPLVKQLQGQKNDNLQRIKATEDAFKTKHGVALGLIESPIMSGNYKLAATPSTSSISSDDLAAYKKEMVSLYGVTRDYDQKILQANGNVDKTFAQAQKELYEAVSLTRALLVGCSNNDFKAEAGARGLKLSPAAAEKATQ